ncbi:MAG: hypothetical protein KME64_37680 [Scytonematopsis contorta HA4267-MV1]|jgi:hypothetical protein|nr:hypothetical protein [Scytonematopsis contorta HA4267-MV1]
MIDEKKQNNYFDLTGKEHEELVQEAVKEVIAKMHVQGVATVEVDEKGKLYLRHSDGSLTPIDDSN